MYTKIRRKSGVSMSIYMFVKATLDNLDMPITTKHTLK